MTVWVVRQETDYNEVFLVGVYKELDKAITEVANSLLWTDRTSMGEIVSKQWDNAQTTLIYEVFNDDTEESLRVVIEKTKFI